MSIPSFAREPIYRPHWLYVWTWAVRGGPPKPPIYMRTRAGTHYEVIRVVRCRPGSESRYRFLVQRIAAEDVPTEARLVQWTWGR